MKIFRAAFPDLHITIEDQVAEADKVCSSASEAFRPRREITPPRADVASGARFR